ncbi:hypothetical protein AB0I28_19855 [Phytomonospora sp. NPDC050363]|uniref:mevalonate kinase family protein n=1 Tax=Phytomonospora sp. NPDC050363 TaxID=3155642 RepID=UPI0033DF0C7E
MTSQEKGRHASRPSVNDETGEAAACAASVPGRICIAGESLDWMTGDASITAAIPARTTVRAARGGDSDVVTFRVGEPFNASQRVLLPELGRLSNTPARYLQATAYELATATTVDLRGLTLSSETDLPVAAGTSSSAAVTVAASAAILGLVKALDRSLDTAVAHAHSAETVHLGTGAGWMDFLACGHGGVVRIQPNAGPKVTRLAESLQCSIVLVDTMERRKTPTVLATKRARFERADPALNTYVDEVGHVVRELTGRLASTSIAHDAVGALVSHAQELLRRLVGCSTELIDECAARMMNAGAFGAKLSGSGYGGCLFALAPPDAVASIRSALSTLPITTHLFDDCEPRGLLPGA